MSSGIGSCAASPPLSPSTSISSSCPSLSAHLVAPPLWQQALLCRCAQAAPTYAISCSSLAAAVSFDTKLEAPPAQEICGSARSHRLSRSLILAYLHLCPRVYEDRSIYRSQLYASLRVPPPLALAMPSVSSRTHRAEAKYNVTLDCTHPPSFSYVLSIERLLF